MPESIPQSITKIDGHYVYEGKAAAYLIVDGDEAAFVDTVTRFSQPALLLALDAAGLTPEQVRYIIVTHVHLDHSGGAPALAEVCKNATVLAHPRAGRHLVDPTRLIAGVRAVYGDRFDELYGVIDPIPEDRVEILEDGEFREMGKRTFTFFDAPGHARHHFVIQDSGTNSVFAGDAFGTCFPQHYQGERPFMNYVCAPPDFDPAVAKKTVQRIIDTGVERVFVTHFSMVNELPEAHEQLFNILDEYDALVNQAAATGLEGEKLYDYCGDATTQLVSRRLAEAGLDSSDETIHFWANTEHMITSKGLAFLAEKRRG
jgi:glyoxylase-like metal-dependent hydrolase (beta-lactamase superfamily II)